MTEIVQREGQSERPEHPGNPPSLSDSANTLSPLQTRIRLRQLLYQSFDIEEIITLCFDLGLDFDDLGGSGKASKTRELIKATARRGQILDLIGQCAASRPRIDWQPFIDAVTSNPDIFMLPAIEDAYKQPVEEGLVALVELMHTPKVRETVGSFQADFRAVCDQLDAVDQYKTLHDLLHTLQYRCYNPLAREASRFPDDELAIENIEMYHLELDQIAGQIDEVVSRSSDLSNEATWVTELRGISNNLALAMRNLDPERLNEVIWRMNRILDLQPSRINTHLNLAAKSLRLPTLLRAMEQISDHLGELDLDPGNIEQFEAGVDTLSILNQGLEIFVKEHDQWQLVDMELRRLDTTSRDNTDQIIREWRYVQEAVHSASGDAQDQWVMALVKYESQLETAIKQQDPVQVRRFFRLYRRQAGERFFQVDVRLKRLSGELRLVSDPLAKFLRMLE